MNESLKITWNCPVCGKERTDYVSKKPKTCSPRCGIVLAHGDRLEFHLNREAEQVVIGSLMGDASIPQNNHGNPRFSVSHRIGDLEYLQWKYRLVNGSGLFPSPPAPKSFRMESYRLISSRHPGWRSYSNLFYPLGTKMVSEGVLGMISDLGLAVWYMDDGSLSFHCYSGNPRVKLYTQGYTVSENEIMRAWLFKEYNFRFHLKKVKGGCGYHLSLTRKYDSINFLDTVRPYVSQVGCMRRKLEAVKSGQL